MSRVSGDELFRRDEPHGTPGDFISYRDRRTRTAHRHHHGLGAQAFLQDEQGLRHFDESDNEMRAENWEWGTFNFTDARRVQVSSSLYLERAVLVEDSNDSTPTRLQAMLYFTDADGSVSYGDTGNLGRWISCSARRFHPHALMIAECLMAADLQTMGGMGGLTTSRCRGWMNDILLVSLDQIWQEVEPGQDSPVAF